MAHLVLERSNYEEHQHRVGDLRPCLIRIQREEADTVDRKKAEEISRTFSCLRIK